MDSSFREKSKELKIPNFIRYFESDFSFSKNYIYLLLKY